jgi:alcohol dehydrogenase
MSLIGKQEKIKGPGTVKQLGKRLIDLGYNNIFLIAGEHFYTEAGTGMLDSLRVIKHVRFGTNVDKLDAENVFYKFRQSETDVIVAIGGGSVIDLAKAVIYRCIEEKRKVPFFVAVPTTAGSGSEATQFAVVYDKEKKVSWMNPALLPKLVVLDAELTYSLPSYQTAVSGMDVLAQAVESYWNVHATDESRDCVIQSIKLWKDSFLDVVNDPSPLVRGEMLEAAHLAGKAINITRTTGPHALSYYLTSKFQIPHGQAVAFFLPLFFVYNSPQPGLCKVLGVSTEKEAAEFVTASMKKANLCIQLADAGISKSEIIEPLLNSVNEERFANNPSPFDREKLAAFINEYL